MTKAELLALNPKDIDLEKRTISITKSYQRLGKKDVITPPKTPKSKRVITIPEFLAADIKDYMDSLYDLQENDRLFPITKYYLEHEMQRGIKESGVKRIRVHDLRHSHASMLIELGFSPLEIANRLGERGSLFGESLRITAGEHGHGTGIFALGAAQPLAALLVTEVGHGAAVHHKNIRFFALRHDGEASAPEHLLQCAGLVQVDLAAKGIKTNSHKDPLR